MEFNWNNTLEEFLAEADGLTEVEIEEFLSTDEVYFLSTEEITLYRRMKIPARKWENHIYDFLDKCEGDALRGCYGFSVQEWAILHSTKA